MKAEILSVGTELLVGSILNTNARFLGRLCADHAIDVYRQSTVGDNASRLAEAFRAAAGRADLVIASGGLGPTEDDVTMKALADCLRLPLVRHEPTERDLLRKLRARGLPMIPLLRKQCFVPRGSVVLPNRFGTAPGVLCEALWEGAKKWFLLLPGPPRECEPMFRNQALPELFKRCRLRRGAFVIRSIRIAGLTEGRVAARIPALLRRRPPLTVGIYAKPGEVELKIMAKAPTRAAALRAARRLEGVVRRRFGSHVFGVDSDTLASATAALLRRRRITLSAAESCTGGLFCGLVTEAPGSSRFFIGGILSYANRLKIGLLGVSASVVEKHGAVSSPVAKAMAEGVRKKLGTRVGVAITGIAGPGGGSRAKPVGLVYVAIAGLGPTLVKAERFGGSRTDVRRRASAYALNLLRLRVLGRKSS